MPSRQTSPSTSPRSRTSNRTGAAARNEILTMLKDDHKRVKKLFRDFEKLDPQDDPEGCQSLVTQACGELELHAALEEELLYPAARNCMAEEDLIDEAEVEHMSAKTLIGQLKAMKPGDEKYAATFKVLGEYIKHHVREEETEMFPQLSNAKLNWQELQQEMSDRREALMGQYMPQAQAASKGNTESLGARTKARGAQTLADESAAKAIDTAINTGND